MRVAIHQPHYFPWLGYFDKAAKVDSFVLMDDVQLEDRSYMCRNSFINRSGEIIYLSVTASKRGYREKKYREIETLDNKKWQNMHLTFFKEVFGYSPYFNEVMENINHIFNNEYKYLFDVTRDSFEAILKMLDIKTEIVIQSALPNYNPLQVVKNDDTRRSDDVLGICLACGATEYLTGSGASLSFLNHDSFNAAGIPIAVQQYECPEYSQRHVKEFVPNISALDMLFNCGIDMSRQIFWDNVGKIDEFQKSN